MSGRRRDLGRRGETLAAWLYRLQGFSVHARNIEVDGVEIDLIARRGCCVAFVEVKTRSTELGGEPWEAISNRQKERLFRAAESYLRRLGEPRLHARYDVVSIVWPGLVPEVRIYRDAWLAMSDPERPWKRTVIANRD